MRAAARVGRYGEMFSDAVGSCRVRTADRHFSSGEMVRGADPT